DAYAKIEKARATGTSTVSNPVTEPELIPAESTPIEPSTPDTTPISIEPAHVIDRGKNLLLNPVTGQATGSNYITGKVIDPGTAIVISAAIQAIFSIFSGQQAQKAAANIGYCRYEREYPTQCLANGEPRCERGDPKYPTLGVNIDPNNLPTNVNEVVASHIYSIATDFSTCRYFAPTKPAETLQALVKVTLYKGHITPPGKTVDCSTQDADGCIVWVKDVQTDINGTFLFQLSAPEPGRYTLFYEARSD
ncbi:MAG: hypothetical protein HZB67_01565, partial [Candidatus Aenigmarchaeota archaeon]|nr:hypothetical protein [Candidatus Aenigmarchaeota archaeon]